MINLINTNSFVNISNLFQTKQNLAKVRNPENNVRQLTARLAVKVVDHAFSILRVV